MGRQLWIILIAAILRAGVSGLLPRAWAHLILRALNVPHGTRGADHRISPKGMNLKGREDDDG